MQGDGRANNKVGRVLRDYRFYIFVLQVVGTVGMAWTLSRLWAVDSMLPILGVSKGTVWDLSPFGVELLKSVVWSAWVGCWLWTLACVLMCFILWIDPYGWHRIRLTPSDKVMWRNPKTDEEEIWKARRTKDLFVRYLYFSADGNTCSTKEKTGWIKLEWMRPQEKGSKVSLNGPGNGPCFKLGAPPSEGKVERGAKFVVGSLEREYRFR